jgi:chromosome partitioning protein
VDLDPSANLSAGLGLGRVQTQKSSADILLGNAMLEELHHPTSAQGLDLIPASSDLVAAFQVLSVRPQYETILLRSLVQSTLPHQFIILDCPPSLGAITISGLTAANLAIVPTQCEYFAIQAVNNVLKLVQRVRKEYNPTLHYRLLVTMFDLRGNLHKNLFDKVQSHYGNALLNTVIGFDSKLRASQIAGVPITEYANRTRATLQYRDLAEEIEAYVEK